MNNKKSKFLKDINYLYKKKILVPLLNKSKKVLANNNLNKIDFIGEINNKIDKKRHVEVHIFNFKNNLYKEDLEIQFISCIRKERKFDSKEDLIKQVKKDISLVKSRFFLP